MEKKQKYTTDEKLNKANTLREPAVGYQRVYSSTTENVYLNIPKDDMAVVEKLAKKMGWIMETKESLLSKYIQSRPTNVDLTEDEIQSEIQGIRYKE